VHNPSVNSTAGAGATATTNHVTDIPGLVNSDKALDLPRDLQGRESTKARVLVVEDNEFVREGIVKVVDGQTDLICCGQANSIASAPAAVAKCRPDLVLMDLRFKDGEAIGLMNTLSMGHSKPKILVLSQCDELLYAERALQAGARGYVMKVEAVDELLIAIRTVLRGRVYLSPAMSARLVKRVLKPGSKAGEEGSRSQNLVRTYESKVTDR
jgi:DNA-binding NarL/FixJ family response regulator